MLYKHTPGKWKAVDEFIGTDSDDPQTIAYLSCHRNIRRRSEEETKTNAKLIESAPDLLEALVNLLVKINKTCIEDWVEIREACEAIKRVDESILEFTLNPKE